MSDRTKALLRILFGVADPNHGVAAILDDDPADLAQKACLVRGAHEGPAARAIGPQSLVEPLKLLLHAFLFRDVQIDAGHADGGAVGRVVDLGQAREPALLAGWEHNAILGPVFERAPLQGVAQRVLDRRPIVGVQAGEPILI